MRYYVIPNLDNLDKYLDLSKKYDLGFEYNEFYIPSILDDKKKLNEIIESYKKLNRLNDTMHGVFFDITLDSADPLIKEVSLKRVESSLEIAKKLNLKGVVFHTNYITWMKDEAYKKNWVLSHKKIYLDLIEKYKDIEIYVENMFDLDPFLLRDLMVEINNSRIGVCLDVAHASISKVPLDIWFKTLMPYIKHLHINDNDLNVDSHMQLGLGKIDYKEAYKYINMLPDNTSILIEIKDYDKTG